MYKKTVMGFLLISIAAGGFAQKREMPTFSIRGGVNFQNINGKDILGDKLTNKVKPGFHIGVLADVPLATEYAMQSGLLFSAKGAKLANSGHKLTISYLEIPINLLYKPVLGDGKLLLGFGPYLAFGLGGKLKLGNGGSYGVKYTSEVKRTDPTDKTYFKRFDAGANLLAGYQLSNGFSIQLNAQLGLVKINPSLEGINNNKAAYKNTGFGISVGYSFGGK
jgi:hypothetical protein